MAILYPAVDGYPAVEESAVADPGSLAQSSAIAITKWAYRQHVSKAGSWSLVGEAKFPKSNANSIARALAR